MSKKNETFSRPKERDSVSLLGTSALLFEAAGAFDLASQRRIWALADTFQQWDGVKEAIPGMTNLMLTFSTPPEDPERYKGLVLQAWEKAQSWDIEGKTVEIPVVYGGELGPHLHDAAQLTGLTIDEVVAIHSGQSYSVFALGAHPGLGYLGITDERIWVPRREVPVLSVPAGSVSIGGMQTAVSASAGASGWHTLGHTDTEFFFPHQDNPTLLAPGDSVTFRVERIIK
ncbi:5-oxoprolinase subunit PxpB [Cohaesibacter intestini]|uniref:5-oxoprolinase subunit PxpB n=1 Tax=Cohaesibacter intestini TaxID=2211145 RepID=UPI000DE943C5|nr:5-oxoprolinase subunit PxpB [Cohaesibacter intestini]